MESNVNSIFEEPWWLDIVSPNSWKEILIEEDNHLVARLPYSIKKNKVTMPQFTPTCGIWIKNDEKTGIQERNENIKKIVEKIVIELSKYRSIQLRLDPSLQYFLPFYWHGFSVIPKVTYRINNLNDLQLIYQNFSKNIKRDIKNAEKKVEIKYDTSPDIMVKLLEKTFREQGRKLPCSEDVIVRIMEESKKRNKGKLITAVDADGNIHAGAYLVYDGNACYYLFAGKDSDFKKSNAQTLVMWKCIEFASKVSAVFDFEGSMIEGIEQFFKRFGGEPTVYFEIRKLTILGEIKELIKPYIKKIIGYK